MTSDAIAKSDAANATQFLSLTSHFDAKSTTPTSLLELGLAGVQNAIAMLPATVPFNVTIVSDMFSSHFETRFREIWGKIYPGRALTGSISCCEALSFAWIEERLKNPVFDIDLILILQITVAVTESIFYKQIKTLHLDIRAREAVNSNAGGVALSTVVRIYQLKDRKTFDTTDYPSLFRADSQAIKADLVAEKDIRLQPGGAVTVDMPMATRAR